MKKVMLTLIATVAILFTNCTPEALDAVDEFNSLECVNKLLKLSENEDDLSCSELIRDLKSLKNSCGDQDGDIQALIILLEQTCED